jgi:hexosaminidase
VILFPCIQTLGHMEHILKYAHYTPIKDNDMIYNVYSEETYAFIEKTIDAARAPYDTDFIHIGMDETHGLGRGLAFKEGEPIHPRRIYVDHLNKVADICRKKGLKPAMWGDIVLGTTGEHKMDESETSRLPKDMTMNYWEYAWCDEAKYSKNLADFKRMGYDPIVSPGVWCWSRFFPAYYKAHANISTLVASAKRAGVQGALNTHWGDDGHECFFDWNLPAHAYFLAQCTETVDVEAAARRKFRAAFGEDFDAVLSVEKIDIAGYKIESLLPSNVGKCFFYDDPAQGLFSGMDKVKPAAEFYRKTAEEMRALSKRKSLFQPLFRFAEAFCDFLSVKADLRRNLASAYKKQDRKALKRLLGDIALSGKKLAKVQKAYRAYWLSERKPFGLEIIDGRMGALAARLDYLGGIVGDYLDGSRKTLPELDFPHYSMFHASRGPDYQPAIWPDFFLHYSALGSRNTIKWW